jgi:hypothetical protein
MVTRGLVAVAVVWSAWVSPGFADDQPGSRINPLLKPWDDLGNLETLADWEGLKAIRSETTE